MISGGCLRFVWQRTLRDADCGNFSMSPQVRAATCLGRADLANASVGTSRVEQDEARPVEQESRGIQILEGAEAALLTGAFDAGEHRGDQLIEQVQDIIEGGDFLGLGEGQQGSVASRRRHPGDGLRPCRRGVSGQDVDSHGRHGGQNDVGHSQTSDLLESL